MPPTPTKKYNTRIAFTLHMLAPCGMNCGSCMAFMRTRKPCRGCRSIDESSSPYCRECAIAHCEKLKNTASGFCGECRDFPCKRLKQLNKRYTTRYHTSLIDNLVMIRERGTESFLAYETHRRTCPQCRATLCIHRPGCFECTGKV